MPTTKTGTAVGSKPRCTFCAGALGMVSTVDAVSPSPSSSDSDALPELGSNGLYQIQNKAQHQAFLEANRDKIVVMKVFAPWCRACKGLQPKFMQVAQNPKFENMPLIFCELSIQHNKEFVKSLGVLALPTVQLYVGSEGLVDTFPCGPTKVNVLNRKLIKLINEKVDGKTLQLKPPTIGVQATATTTAAGATTSSPAAATTTTNASATTVEITNDQKDMVSSPKSSLAVDDTWRKRLRASIPYFAEVRSDQDFNTLMDKATALSFEAGSIIMREGNPGRTFYVIYSGEVEICQKTNFEDPLTIPPSYIGTVINRLEEGDFFGERALITGEPRAASIRAAEPTLCLAWDRDDFMDYMSLSGRSVGAAPATIRAAANDKYGVALNDLNVLGVQAQILDATVANQVRGSANTPELIRGVDFDVDGDEEEEQLAQTEEFSFSIGPDAVLLLLQRFHVIRQVTRCFEYIVQGRATLGPQARKRRAMLVSRLTEAQRSEWTDVFHMIDVSGDGEISLLELKRVMVSIGEEKSDDELEEMIRTSCGRTGSGQQAITMEDFLGIMAEAEFYNLFRDTFAALDTHNTGFVKARDLDRVLGGVRDLIFDDRKSLIDVEDQDILIDYERFSKMLLGAEL